MDWVPVRHKWASRAPKILHVRSGGIGGSDWRVTRTSRMTHSRSFTEIGGLISYGPFIVDEYRRAASYADRILKVSKPSELPVQALVKFEQVVNLKAAKALGFDVPPSLLAAADEVID
jgi:putative tryptophan/tyrosine transport system substrate-binding protein